MPIVFEGVQRSVETSMESLKEEPSTDQKLNYNYSR
jgi:hypothetical protein